MKIHIILDQAAPACTGGRSLLYICMLAFAFLIPEVGVCQNLSEDMGGVGFGTNTGLSGLGGLGSMGSNSGGGGTWGRDTSKVEKSVPTEFHQWRIGERLGERMAEEYNDTLPHGFQNYDGTDGLAGGYMILGNLGSPRYAVNFLDRPQAGDLIFIEPYDFFHTTPGNLLWTNTKSPLTNLQYHKSGTRTNGQDRFRAYFASNVNKETGLGFKIDYLYGRGYYNNQANSQFGGTVFGYHLGERYEVHAMGSWEHMKMSENGGVTDDAYITDPESFARKVGSRDIPTVFSSLYNRNDHQTYFLTQRFNLGRYDEIEVPDSLKPVAPGDDVLLRRWKVELIDSLAGVMMGDGEELSDGESEPGERGRDYWTRTLRDSLVTALRADSVRYGAVVDSLRGVWAGEQVSPRVFVPISSIVHTLDVRRLSHSLYNRGSMPSDYFSHEPYYGGSWDSFRDITSGMSVKNTIGLELREGWGKWAKAGISLFAAHEFDSYTLPDSVGWTDSTSVWNYYRENHISVGGEVAKRLGRTLHYRAGLETWLIGPDAGDMDVHAEGDLNVRLGGDTLRVIAKASFTNKEVPFYYEHYHSRGRWWDNDRSKERRTRLEGVLSVDRTHTRLRVGVENLKNYAYLGMKQTGAADGAGSGYPRDVVVGQHGGNIQVLSAELRQDLHLGFFHLENSVMWQHSSDADVLPLPTLYVYTNPYVKVLLAKVLTVEVGADMRFWTKYYGMDYDPFLNQFAIQDASAERVKIGGYPIMHAYANFAIKRVRGYIQYTRFAGGNGNAFWAPHYPIDPSGLHFGVSWNFYD